MENSEDYVNILLLHQNRYRGNLPGKIRKNCFQPRDFPDFFHLIIWGHEHESIPQLEYDSTNQVYVY